MNRRLLTTLLLLAFLGSSGLSAVCLSGTCSMEPIASHEEAAPGASGEHGAAPLADHCDATVEPEATSSEATPMAPAPMASWEDCCAPALEERAAAALSDQSLRGIAGLEPSADLASSGVTPLSHAAVILQGPAESPPPLFTLHAAFLI